MKLTEPANVFNFELLMVFQYFHSFDERVNKMSKAKSIMLLAYAKHIKRAPERKKKRQRCEGHNLVSTLHFSRALQQILLRFRL